MNVSIKKAADLMGISQQFLRVLIQNGEFPFATAVKMKDGNKRYHYYVSERGLAEHIGKSIEEVRKYV